jgi:hypothetical protein
VDYAISKLKQNVAPDDKKRSKWDSKDPAAAVVSSAKPQPQVTVVTGIPPPPALPHMIKLIVSQELPQQCQMEQQVMHILLNSISSYCSHDI